MVQKKAPWFRQWYEQIPCDKNQNKISPISSNTCVPGGNTLLANIGRELVNEFSRGLQHAMLSS